MMRRRNSRIGVLCLLLWPLLAAPAAGQKADRNSKEGADSRKPKISLNARPRVGMSPTRVVLTAEISGGPNDFEEFYCPTVVWEWGDGTRSEAAMDCAPYEAGKSEIQRRFSVAHVFTTGTVQVVFHLKQRDKTVGMANVTIQVRPGLRDIG